MAPVNYRKVRKHFLIESESSHQKRELFNGAYKNSLRKTTTPEGALGRILTARDIRHARKYIRYNLEPSPKKILAAHKNTVRKYGEKSVIPRRTEAVQIRDGRILDGAKEWGVSFRAGLQRLDKFYAPHKLTKLISDYLKEHKLKKIKILEVGAGIGNAASELREKFGTKTEITATGLKHLKEWDALPRSRKINWKLAHTENLKRVAQSGSIDILHSNLGFGHATSPEKALAEARRVLKRNGLLLFTAEKRILEKIQLNGFELINSGFTKQRTRYGSQTMFVYLLKKK